jgi:uncharacterized protein YecT (DUF1311 family)
VIIVAILVAALNCGATATQIDLDECAAGAQTHSDKLEAAAFQTAEWRTYNDPLLHLSEMRWDDARRAACAFDAALVAGGSMQPMVEAQCNAASALARVRDIRLFTGLPNPTAAIPDQRVQAEHERIYGLLELLVTPQERGLLADSERAFMRYRNTACSHAKDGCATALTTTRTQQLKDSWMAEPFWK